ncbi:hypothetical protein [Paenibacillus sp. HW567]|uniref:hypothetical protein n=1 Tax=Paenibacillus sp. HW567 TaxID=1034769 RepID=UPI00055FF747|nr:hypothetical protein [Paenibacillus sp. HW567]
MTDIDAVLRKEWDEQFCPKCRWNLKGSKPQRHCTHCDYTEAAKPAVRHECNGRPSSWMDVHIEYDPGDKEWGLVVDGHWCKTIEYCPHCGIQLTVDNDGNTPESG